MTVFEQLTDYCDCLKEVKETDVEELINLISVYTCWAQKPCETFLMSERKEVVDLPNCTGKCDVFTFSPFYAPFDPDSFTFTLIEQSGITETKTPISSYIYSDADEEFRVELPLPSCKCTPKCGCESNYKLLVEYAAGYDQIPQCLLPVFCDALQVIYEKNDCECNTCEPCDTGYVTPTQPDYTKLRTRLEEYFLNILTAQYQRQLALISLCMAKKNIWGFVI